MCFVAESDMSCVGYPGGQRKGSERSSDDCSSARRVYGAAAETVSCLMHWPRPLPAEKNSYLELRLQLTTFSTRSFVRQSIRQNLVALATASDSRTLLLY